MKKKELNKVVMIGPVYPYKGGISHYTGMMFKYLEKKYNVEIISYRMQYPKILFKKEQKDYVNDAFKVNNVKYWINTATPLNWFIVGKRIKKIKPDLIIMQWWHPYFAPCYWILQKVFKKVPTLIVCHNVFPHERFLLDKRLTRAVLRNGNAFIVHSSMDATDLKSIVRNPLYRLSTLPNFNMFQLNNLSKKDAREILKLSDNEQVLLFFGFVRKYKGLKYLLEAMVEIKKQLPSVKLLVVGDFDGDKNFYVNQIENLNLEDIITIYDGYTPDKEVEKYFVACDLVVLPYESATQSGIVQVAYGFDKPCVVTNVGGLPEVVLDHQTGYVVEPKNPIQISKAVCNYFLEDRQQEFSVQIRKEADKYSWERMIELIENLYQEEEL